MVKANPEEDGSVLATSFPEMGPEFHAGGYNGLVSAGLDVPMNEKGRYYAFMDFFD